MILLDLQPLPGAASVVRARGVGNKAQIFERVASIAVSGVNMITLLALDDSGAPCFDHDVAGTFTSQGVPSFACTPDLFPDLMASAIQRRDIGRWAATQGIKMEHGTRTP